MALLQLLKAASTRDEIAALLRFKTSMLTYVLYKLPIGSKYTSFPIPKKSGGFRQIDAPTEQLKTLQTNLSRLLYSCQAEIEGANPNRKSLSHGFRKGHSIVTNASLHKNRRYVLNVDLKDFFPSVTFPRVRGFFLKNHDFALNERVATIIAQIACFEKGLPQGSPCSPIVADMVGHLLDVRLTQLAKAHKCSYSRYVDDLTFSTNQKQFPTALAHRADFAGAEWVLGDQLKTVIANANFAINDAKTRMQCAPSRQIVTGLTVNKKVNVRADYYRQARAMCNSLFAVGAYHNGDPTKIDASAFQIEGILNHIHYVKNLADQRDETSKRDIPIAARKLYRSFLFYKNFVALDRPLVLCEGVTDNVYLKAAIRHLPEFQQNLAVKVDKSTQLKVRFFKYSKLTDGVLRLGGGAGGIKKFLESLPVVVEAIQARADATSSHCAD